MIRGENGMGFMCKCRYCENGDLVLGWKNLFGRGSKMLFRENY